MLMEGKLIIKHQDKYSAAATVNKIVKKSWENAVEEVALESNGLDCIFYQDADSQKIWNSAIKVSEVKEGQANMIYCIYSDKELMIVYDKDSSSCDALAKVIQLNFLKLEVMRNNPHVTGISTSSLYSGYASSLVGTVDGF